jgi:hypothetical protein
MPVLIVAVSLARSLDIVVWSAYAMTRWDRMKRMFNVYVVHTIMITEVLNIQELFIHCDWLQEQLGLLFKVLADICLYDSCVLPCPCGDSLLLSSANTSLSDEFQLKNSLFYLYQAEFRLTIYFSFMSPSSVNNSYLEP